MKLADIPNPTAVFFQPVRYLAALAADGVTVFSGPEVENAGWLRKNDPATLARKEREWMDAVTALGCGMILKNPKAPVPANCVGFLINVDEPNSKGTPPAALDADYNALRALDPTMPIFMSVYGGQVTSANYDRPHELQLIRDYAARCDIFLANTYPANINASRHKMTWTGDAVKKLHEATGKPVWAVVEMNDQQLPKPTSKTNKVDLDINRAPTPEEIQATVDYAMAQGASGLMWFATCQRGSYGWGLVDPAKGDSYWPLVDRNGVSIRPQLDMVRAIGLARKAPAPLPADPAVAALAEKVADLETQLAAARAESAAAKAEASGVRARFDSMINAATQPTTQAGK